MNVRRFFARDMSQGLKMVQDVLGADAVILSNTRVNGGVELIVSEDYNEQELQEMRRKAASRNRQPPRAIEDVAVPDSRQRPSVRTAETGAPVAATPAAAIPEYAETAKPQPVPQAARTDSANAGEQGVPPRVLWTEEPVLKEMREEIRTLRGLLQQQIPALAWGELGKRHPVAASLMHRLTEIGFDHGLARELAESLPDGLDLETAWHNLRMQISSFIPINNSLFEQTSEAVAVLGPAGCGKTSTLSKLAIRAALRRTAARVHLVSMDSQRIGAHSQLSSIGQIAGLGVERVSNRQGLETLYAQLGAAEQLFIDNAGYAAGADTIEEQTSLYQQLAFDVDCYLVLPGTAQLEYLNRCAAMYAGLTLKGVIITHMDEVTQPGTLFSALIRSRLPLAGFSNGQQIPDDLQPASTDLLWSLAAPETAPSTVFSAAPSREAQHVIA